MATSANQSKHYDAQAKTVTDDSHIGANLKGAQRVVSQGVGDPSSGKGVPAKNVPTSRGVNGC